MPKMTLTSRARSQRKRVSSSRGTKICWSWKNPSGSRSSRPGICSAGWQGRLRVRSKNQAPSSTETPRSKLQKPELTAKNRKEICWFCTVYPTRCIFAVGFSVLFPVAALRLCGFALKPGKEPLISANKRIVRIMKDNVIRVQKSGGACRGNRRRIGFARRMPGRAAFRPRGALRYPPGAGRAVGSIR